MYDPKGNGKTRAVGDVSFTETAPPARLRNIVHRFLELQTSAPLAQDYRFHALPDACTYIVFDQTNPQITGVTRLKASSEELNLGRSFHFTNIRFLPGVWQRSRAPVSFALIDSPYNGPLPLLPLARKLPTLTLADKHTALATFVDGLLAQGLVVANPVTQKIFANLTEIHSVADMAEAASLSARQLQRVLKQTTGFTPHDFLKVLRLQQSLRGEPSLSYADQSHFIHSFRKATGYTPGRYAQKFDV